MKVAMQNTVEHSMKVAMDLVAHEKECAMFRELVHGKLDSLDKRMWRLEAMIMGSTVLVVAMVVSVFMGLR